MTTSNRMVAARSLGVVCALVLFGCADAGPGASLHDGRFRDFQQVIPVLARDCGFHTCHGSEERFFRVYGPGRARLDSDTKAFDGLTGDEASASFQSALSFIDTDNPEQSLLLRKPLAVAAGGAGHEGEDPYGRDVYRSVDDQGYLAIARFVFAQAPQDEDTEEEGEE